MGLRDKLQKARFTAEGAGRLAKSKLSSSASEARDRARDVDAKRVARKAGRATQRVVAAAEAEGASRQRDNRDAVAAAGREAQMSGPLDASLQPLSGPEQTHLIAGGAPQRGQPLDRLAVGEMGPASGQSRQQSRGRDRQREPQPVIDVGFGAPMEQMAVGGVGAQQSSTSSDGKQSGDGGSSDPLVVDSPFVMGGDDGQR